MILLLSKHGKPQLDGRENMERGSWVSGGRDSRDKGWFFPQSSPGCLHQPPSFPPPSRVCSVLAVPSRDSVTEHPLLGECLYCGFLERLGRQL